MADKWCTCATYCTCNPPMPAFDFFAFTKDIQIAAGKIPSAADKNPCRCEDPLPGSTLDALMSGGSAGEGEHTVVPFAQWVKESIVDKRFEDWYTLQDEIGRGTHSEVYKCTDKIGFRWAVKIISKNVTMKIQKLSEISRLLHVDNPNVVLLNEVYETTKKICLVLELCSPEDILDRIAKSPFYTEKHATNIIHDVLLGLKYLHQKEIVHRNIKPENLLFQNEEDGLDSCVKIADFGLSRIVGPEFTMSRVCGYPCYCAPEVLKGVKKYEPSVDMWSLGVVVYMMLCGYDPFCAESEAQVYRRVLKADFRFEGEAWEQTSELAKDFVLSLLVKNPDKRLTACAAFRHPWMTTQPEIPLPMAVENLKDFNKRRKFKEAIRDTLADSMQTNKVNPVVLWSQSV